MAIQTKCNENSVFSFSMLSLKQIEKEIILSKLNKALHLNIQINQLKLSRKTQIYF